MNFSGEKDEECWFANYQFNSGMMEALQEISHDLIEKNLRYTLFPWSKQNISAPLLIERGEGVYFYDHTGKKYLDFSSQLVNVNIGHGHPQVKAAVMRQMDQISYVQPNMVTAVRGRLGEKLSSLCPGEVERKTFFTLGGSEAIENAIKLARVYTQRQKIVSFYQSYHGSTNGAMTVSGDPRRFPVDNNAMPNVVRIENPYAYRCPWRCGGLSKCNGSCVDHVERILHHENPESFAAILLEGESGSSGCLKYPDGYLKNLRELADRYGILIIDDEVMSGFGRTGRWFAIEHHGIVPDIICVAKGLTAGYVPLGAVIVTKEIADTFNEKPLPLGLTYGAHPVSLAAAAEVIRIYEDEDLIAHAAKMGVYMDARLEELAQMHPSIGDVRNTGLFGCLEIVRNRSTKEPLVPWNALAKEMAPMNAIASRLLSSGLSTMIRWNWIFVTPPLIITEEQIDEGLNIISDALRISDSYVNETV